MLLTHWLDRLRLSTDLRRFGWKHLRKQRKRRTPTYELPLSAEQLEVRLLLSSVTVGDDNTPAGNPPVGDVGPTSVEHHLLPGEQMTETVSLTVDPGDPEIDVIVSGDFDEDFNIDLSDPTTSGSTDVMIDPASAGAGTTIVYDLPDLTFSISGESSASEDGDNTADYTIGYSGTLGENETASVNVAHQLGTGNDSGDYDVDVATAITAAITAGAQGVSFDGTTLTFTGGAGNDTSLDFTVEVNDDTAIEGDESYSIELSEPATSRSSIAVLGTSSVETTITSDDLPPEDIVFSISGGTAVTEDSADGDANEVDYTISYTGTLAVGETASVDVTHYTEETESNDYAVDVVAALTAAAAATANVSFDGSTLTFNNPGPVSTSDSGFAGTAVGGPGGDGTWQNISNATGDTSSTYSHVDLDKNDDSNTLRLTNFGLSIPTNSTIDGIEVALVTTGSDNPDNSVPVQITQDGSTAAGNPSSTTGTWSSGSVVAGGSSDLWGTTWSAADLNASSFGVLVDVDADDQDGRQFRVYTAEITVHYTIPGVAPASLDFTVEVADETAYDGDESYRVDLSNASTNKAGGAAIAAASAGTTITDHYTGVAFYINGTPLVSQDSSDADNNEATYTIGYTGTLAAGETASVDVTHVLDETETGDYTTDVVAALTTAAAAVSGISFDGTTLTFSEGAPTSLDFTVVMADDPAFEILGETRVDDEVIADLRWTGDGETHVFDVQFVEADDYSSVLGSVPVTLINHHVVLTEEGDFQTLTSDTFTIDDTVAAVSLQFADLQFDTTSTAGMPDAFELALVDASGQSVVPTIKTGRDAFFNWTEGESPQYLANVDYDDLTGTITVDVQHITTSTQVTLVARLVNNDGDTATTVTVEPHALLLGTSPIADPSATTPTEPSGSPQTIDFGALTDVTADMTVDYGATSFHDDDGVLFAETSMTHSGSTLVRGPLLLVVQNISSGQVTLADSDGTTPGGDAYYDLSHLISGDSFDPAETLSDFSLRFANASEVTFDYDLQILAHLNVAPQFDTNPLLVALPDSLYSYDAGASDTEDDPLTYSLVTGPQGLTVDSQTGLVEWTPSILDLGDHQVILQVSDAFGGSDQQSFTLTVSNDDVLFSISASSDYVYEGITAGSANEITYTIGYTGPLATNETASVDVTHVTDQTGGSDYTTDVAAAITTAISAGAQGVSFDGTTLTFTGGPGNDTSLHFTVLVADDAELEGAETYSVGISDPATTGTNAVSIVTASVGTTIVDDDLNEPPVLDLDLNDGTASGADYQGLFIEDRGPVRIADADTQIVDLDEVQLASATVTLTNAKSGDVLFVEGTLPGGIQADVTTPSGEIVVTLTGSASLADYQTAIAAIRFNNTIDAPDDTARVINVVVNDGEDDSNTATSTIQVIAGNPHSGNVDPTELNLHLLPQEQATETVTLYFDSGTAGAIPTADIVFVVDESGSMAGEHAWIIEVAQQLEDALEAQGVTDNRFALTGYLAEGSLFNMAPVNVKVSIYDASGTLVDEAIVPTEYEDNSGGNSAFIQAEFNLPADGLYYAVVESDSLDEQALVSIEAENYHAAAAGIAGDTWSVVDDDSASGGQQVEAGPDDGDDYNAGQLSDAPRLDYEVDFEETGNYYVWLRGQDPGSSGNKVYVGVNGDVESRTGFGGQLTWVKLSGRLNVTSTGVQTLSLWMGEDGVEIDKIVLTKDDSFSPSILGPTQSLQVTAGAPFQQNTSSLEYSFVLQDNSSAVSGASLDLNDVTQGAISPAADGHDYTFTLGATTDLFFESLSDSGEYTWTLTGPGGDVVTDRAFDQADLLLGAMATGTYTLAVNASDNVRGGYRFRLLDLTDATSLSTGTAIDATLDPVTESEVYALSVTAGVQYYFDAQSWDGDAGARWRLIDDAGSVLFDQSLDDDQDLITAASTGTYYLVVEGDPAESATTERTFSFTARDLGTQAAATTALTLGTQVDGSLTQIGERQHYTFTLGAESLVYFDSLTDSTDLNWSLSNSSGEVVPATELSGGNAVLRLASDSYTLNIDAAGDQTGSYSFNLRDLTSATTLTPDTPEGDNLDPAGETHIYSFTATAGDKYSFDSVSWSGSAAARWKLVDPFGNVLRDEALSDDHGTLLLHAGGVYTLLVEGAESDTGTPAYSVNVDSEGTDTSSPAPLTLNQVTSGEIATSAEQDQYTFTLASAGQYYLDALADHGPVRWSLSDSSGAIVTNRDFSASNAAGVADADTVLSLGADTYTLTVDADTGVTGDYAFRLLELATAAASITPGSPTDVAFTAQATAVYSFTATADDRLHLNLADWEGSTSARWRLVDDSGTVLAGDDLETGVGGFVLTAGGTYYLIIEGDLAESAPSRGLSVQVDLEAVASTQSLTLGALTAGTVASAGDLVEYTFSGTAGEQVVLDFSSAASTDHFIRLRGPDGQVILETSYNSTNVAAQVTAAVLDQTGDYQLVAGADNNQTGTYEFQLSLRDDVLLDGQVTGLLDNASSREVHQFQGIAGQTVQIRMDVWGSASDLSYAAQRLTTDGGVEDGYNAIDVSLELLDFREGASKHVILVTDEDRDDNENPTLTWSGLKAQLEAQGITLHSILNTTIDTANQAEDALGIEGDATDSYAFFVDTDGQDGDFIAEASGGATFQSYHNTNDDYVDPTFELGGTVWDLNQLRIGGEQGTGFATALSFSNAFVAILTNQIQDDFEYDLVSSDPEAGFEILSETLTEEYVSYEVRFTGDGEAVRVFDLQFVREDDPTLVEGSIPVIITSEFVQLVEETNFQTFHSDTFTLDGTTAAVSIKFSDLQFDSNDADGINDAFELALVDENGRSLVGTFHAGRDAFFNLTEGETVALGGGVLYDAATGTVTVDVSHLAAGTEATLLARLVNNDADTTTSVVVDPVATLLSSSPVTDPTTTTPLNAGTPGQTIDAGRLSDVTAGMTVVYNRTSFEGSGEILLAGAAVTNDSTFPVRGPIVVAVRNIDQPSVTARDFDGLLPDGTPYWDITHLIDGEAFDPGETISGLTLAFYNPDQVQFGYELQVLGQLNEAPVFLSTPDIEVVAGKDYTYQAEATDADGDALTYSLLTGPQGLSIDSETGEVTWTTDSADVGSHPVVIRVEDPYGGAAQQSFALQVVENVPNRPPVFTSVPIVDAFVNSTYIYQATADDADGDDLTYSVVSGPGGLAIADPSDGLVTWTPAADDVDQLLSVTLKVEDGNGGEALQDYLIAVHQEIGNHDPIIISDPNTTFVIPNSTAAQTVGDVDPTSIDISLYAGEEYQDTFTLNFPGENILTSDTVIIVDMSDSMEEEFEEYDWAGGLISTLNWTLEQQGYTENRFSFMGYTSDGRLYSANTDPFHVFVYGPDDELVRDVWVGTLNWNTLELDTFNLPADGEYVVVIEQDGEAVTDNYRFELASAEDAVTTSPLSFDSQTRGKIKRLGQVDAYEFTLNEQSRIWFDSEVDYVDSTVRWTLVDAEGNVIFQADHHSNDQVVELAAGDYALKLDRTGALGADYIFRAYNFTATTELAFDTQIAGTLDPATGAHAYGFHAEAGERFSFDSVAWNGSPAARWRLIAPDGTILFDTALDNDQAILTLPVSGRQLLVIEGDVLDEAATADYSFTVFEHGWEDWTTFGTPFDFNTDFSQTVPVSPPFNMARFELDEESLVYFDIHDADDMNDMSWQVQGIDGVVIPAHPFLLSNAADVHDSNVIYRLPAGAYRLVVVNSGSADADYYSARFIQLHTDADEITPGEEVTGTLNTPNARETHVYSFDATAGNAFSFESTTTSAHADATWRIVAPSGEVIYSHALADDEPTFSVSESGTYFVLIEGATDDTATTRDYGFILNAYPYESLQTIAVDDVVNGTIDDSSQSFAYQLDVTSSATLYFDNLSDNTGLTWKLLGPTGDEVIAPATFAAGNQTFSVAPDLYTLVVESTGGGTGDFSFRVLDWATSGQALTQNELVTLTLDEPMGSQIFTFFKGINNPTSLDSINWTGAAGVQWEVRSPGGVVVFSGDITTDHLNLPLAIAGQYKLLIEGATGETNPAPTLELQVVNDGQFIDFNTQVDDTLPDLPAGSQRKFYFDLEDSRLVYLDVLNEFTSADLIWSLENEHGTIIDGKSILETDAADADADDLVLNLHPGQYVLTITNETTADTDISFRLLDLATFGTVDADTVTGGTLGAISARETDVYAFDVAARGEQYTFDSLTSSAHADARWRLVDEVGDVLWTADLTDNVADFTFTDAGTYYLLIEGAVGDSQSSQSYSFEIVTGTPQTLPDTSLTLGQTYDGRIRAAGETDTYEFTLGAAASLYLDSLLATDQIGWSLTGPGGAVVTDRAFDASNGAGVADADVILDLAAGSYTLDVAGLTGGMGLYSFRLLDIDAAASTLNSGTGESDTLTPGSATHVYQFTISAEQRFQLKAQSWDGGADARWRLIDPSGDVVVSRTMTTSAGYLPLTETGTYTLLIEGDDADHIYAHSYQLTADWHDVTSTQALTLGDVVDGTIATAGDLHEYTFSGTAGQKLYFDWIDADTSFIRAVLSGPDGQRIFDSAGQAASYHSSIDTTTLAAAGTYRLALVSATATGDYSFRLIDLDDQAQFALNDTISGQFDAASGQAVRRFDGQAGEKVSLRLTAWGTAADIQLVTEEASSLFGSEDGYQGIDIGLDRLEFRQHAAKNMILITDEDRDVTSGPAITYRSLLEDLAYEDVTLHAIVDMDISVDNPAIVNPLGVDGAGTTDLAYYVDVGQPLLFGQAESGGATFAEYPNDNNGNTTTEQDYIDLVFDQGGSVWDLRRLRNGGTTAAIFANAVLVKMLTDIIEELELDVVATDGSVDFEVLDMTINQDSVDFDVRITGDGQSHAFDFQIVRKNHPSVLFGAIPTTINVDYFYDVDAVDPDEDPLAYELLGETHGASIDPASGVLRWTPTEAGDYTFTVRTTDGRGGLDEQTWTVTVVTSSGNNTDPTLDSEGPFTLETGRSFRLELAASDPDGDQLSYQLIGDLAGNPVPAGVTIDFLTGVIDWTPDETQLGNHTLTVRVADGLGGFDTETIDVTVEEPESTIVYANNRPSVISVPTDTAYFGEEYRYDVDAIDVDGDPITYEMVVAPDGAAFNAETGLIVWRPTPVQFFQNFGYQYFIVRVADDQGGVFVHAFRVYMDSENPSVEIVSTPADTTPTGELYSYQVLTTDESPIDAATFALTDAPAGMSIDAETGLLTWTPSTVGLYDVTLTATDRGNNVAVQSYQLWVHDPPQAGANQPPTITSTPAALIPKDQLHEYQLTVTDPDSGDTHTYELLDAPAGASLNTSTGLLSWTPDATGAYSFAVGVSDDTGDVDLQVFEIEVFDPTGNTAPALTGTPPDSVRANTLFVFRLTANDADGDPLTFSLVSGPTGMQVEGDLLTWTPGPGDLTTPGSPVQYTVRVEDGRGGSDEVTYDLDVVDTFGNSVPVITSTPGETTVLGQTYTYDADATDADGELLYWTLVEAPFSMTLDAETGEVSWSPTVDQLGQHTVTLTVSDTQGGQASQSFTLEVTGVNRPPLFTSTPVTQGYYGKPYTYQVEAYDPDGGTLTYSLPAGAVGMGIDSQTGLIGWTPDAVGSVPVIIRVTDEGGATAEQSYQFVVIDSNQRPVVTSSPTHLAVIGEPWQYDFDADDPDLDTLTYALTQAPAGMTIDSETGVIDWTPAAGDEGQHYVTATVTDGQLGVSHEFWLTVRGNTAPTVAPLDDVTLLAGSTFSTVVLALDPEGDPLTYELTQSPAGMAIDDLGRITWQTSEADVAVHTVEVTVTDSYGDSTVESFDLTIVSDTADPVVIIIPGANPAPLGDTLVVQVEAFDNVDVESLALTVNGDPYALTGDGFAYIPVDTLANIVLEATATDAAGNVGTKQTTITVFDADDTDYPDVAITSPTAGTRITAPTEVTGTVDDPNGNLTSWTLELIPEVGATLSGSGATGSASAIPIVIATGTTEIIAGTLGTIDPTLLANGLYTLRLTATDAGGNVSKTHLDVTVEGRLKLGNFNLSFVDLQIPVAGIPITVTRSYDTLNAAKQGDFGFGWTLDVTTATAQVSIPGVLEPDEHTPFVDGTRVEITLPDGTTEGFTFVAQPGSGLQGATFYYVPTFIPDPGVTSQLIVDTAQLNDAGNGAYQSKGSPTLYTPAQDEFGGAYTLILRNGIQLTIDAEYGQLSSVTDRAGNTLFYFEDGILSDTGRAIEFERDYAGRITAVIDPAGNRITYEYDANGDLISVTDRVGAVTQFNYLDDPGAPQHYLDEITDPLGNPAARTEYDAEGRLSKVIDAEGQEIVFDYKTTGTLVQTITDQFGNDSFITLDERGNVIREVDALGGITKRTFDADDNILTETRVIGLEDSESSETDDLTMSYTYNNHGDVLTRTDAAGNTTFYAYTDYGGPLTVTNALGSTARTTYDDRGLPTAVRDGSGNVTRFSYDEFGNLTSTTDPLGNTSTLEYNQYGEVTASTDPLGNRVEFTYDNVGNQVTTSYEWVNPLDPQDVRTLVSETEYDALGRAIGRSQSQVVGSNSTLLWETSTEYNAAGLVSATVDGDGLRTEFTYDTGGQQIQVRRQALDESGIVVWLVSRTVYDAVGRVVAQTNQHVEGTSDPIRGSLTTYDAGGNAAERESVIAIVIDLVGSAPAVSSVLTDAGTTITSTTTVYDTSSRLVSSTDSYGLLTEVTYDALGRTVERRSQAIDETGSTVWIVSRTVYDEFGRVVLSTDRYLDSSSAPIYATLTEYDSLGRAFKTTRLEDVQVDVVAGEAVVTDYGTALFSNETVYDSLGRVAQTIGAEGQINDYKYDSLGRQSAVIGPVVTVDGVAVRHRTETQYNSLGQVSLQRSNVKQFTDGTTDATDAQETTFEYDQFGNVVKTTFDDGTYITAEFDDQGQKVSETNQLGLTRTFEYDDAGRLVAVELPGVLNPATGQVESPRYEYTYDAQGNQTLIRDPLGHETQFTYNSQGRQLTRTLPLGFGVDGIEGTADDSAVPQGDFSERYEYDDRGRRTLHVSFEGVVTQFVYDSQTGRLAEQRFFDDLTAYDDGNGTPTETWEYVYDAFGRQVKVTRTKGAEVLVTDMTYDARGQLVEVASPEGTVSYTYDNFGRRLSTIVGTLANPERITSFTYDALGRLATVTEDLDPDSTADEELETSYQYDLAGNLDRTDLPNGVIEDYEYDELNRLDKLTQYAPDETPEDLSDNDKIAEFDYTVRADGRRTSVTETFWYDDNSDGTPDPHVTQTDWEYDELGRLIDEAFDHFDDLLDQTAHFTYDLNGNRLKQTIDKGSDGSIDETTEYTYDANDRLITESADSDGDTVVDQTTTYGYDHTQQTGKTVVDESTSQTTSATAFTYDLQGRMETVTITSYTAGVASRIEKTTYDYNSSGIRVSALHEVDTDADLTFDQRTLTEYLNDAHNHTGYSQVLRETHYDADTDTIIKTVDYTFGHDEIAQTVTEYDAQGAVTSQETQVFGHDGHGSVRVLMDMAAAVAQLYFYDAYGQVLGVLNGAGTFVGSGAADALTTVLYSGEQFDSRIAQQYLRARWYNPMTGSFNRIDPFFGSLQDPQSFHKYLYTHGDPVNAIDPSGLSTLTNMMVGGAIGGALAGMYIAHITGRNPLAGAFVGAVVGAAALAGVFYTGASLAFLYGTVGGGAGGTIVAGMTTFSLAAFLEALRRTSFDAAVNNQRPRVPWPEKARRDHEYALLAFDVYPNDFHNTAARLQPAGWEPSGADLASPDHGYHARYYINQQRNELALVFEGTDPLTLSDWANNVAQGVPGLGEGFQYRQAKADAEEAQIRAQQLGLDLVFVGHSLGGGLATAAALHTNSRAVTFNAAGVHHATVSDTGGLASAAGLLTHYRVRGEILSTLQDSALPGWIIPNSNSGDTYWLTSPDREGGIQYQHSGAVLDAMEELF